jgi:type I restriction enzyme S subunit
MRRSGKDGWETKTLGEVCDFEGGSQPPKSEFIYEEKSGYVRFLQIRDFASDRNVTYIPQSAKNRLCNQGDTLIGRYGASVGKILTNKAGAYNVALMKTIPNLAVLDRSWFRNYLVSDEFQSRLLNVADRSAQAGFSKDDIYSFPVPIPPLPEQRRIVGILDEAFEGIATAKANAEKNLQNARALFESHLQSVFTQRGQGWEETTIDECIKFIDYRGKTPEKTESGLRLITAKNVKMGFLQEEPMEFVAPETYGPWMTRGIPRKGDVLFTTEAPLANIAQLDTADKVVFAQRIIIMQPDAHRLDSSFLKYLLLSRPVQRRIHAKGTGATVQGIKAKLLKTVEIAFPKTTAEQRKIVGVLDALSAETQRLASIYQQKLAALDELKKSLLHQAFSGQL